MSERYCEREILPTSSQIIRKYYFREQNFLFPNEITMLQKYCQYESAYLNLYGNIRMFGICPVQGLSIEQAEVQMEYYNNKLIELENSIEMRNFFCRIKEKEFIMSYGGGDDVKSVRETQDFSQIEEYIKKAEEVIKEKTNVNLAPPHYKTKGSSFTMNEKSVNKIEEITNEIIAQKNEEHKQASLRQEERRELNSCLLQLVSFVIAPCLIVGVLILIAIYLL